MAALLTSVIDNAGKVSSYIMTCRSMGIRILPPDVNEGMVGFSVKDGAIVYALTAIKGVGRNIIDALVAEREQRGPFKNLQDFITRMADADLNKRVVENFIKAGAFDSLPGTRKQQMSVYVQIMDSIIKDKKNNMAGQLSLFDLAGETEKADYDIKMPEVGEYKKEVLLGFEKEVIGFYISGHPLEEYEALWKKRISTTTAEFALDEELGCAKIQDGMKVTVGGIIAGKTIKYTKNDKMMAFLTLEDLAGSVEVVVFPRDYEKYASKLQEEEKVFITGKTSVEEDKDGKIILESMITFAEVPKQLWVKFASIEAYEVKEKILDSILAMSEGNDEVVIFCEAEKQMKKLARNRNVRADEELLGKLRSAFGEENIKLV
jgi:DNA polymerase-3 subunit alpha